jgi:hypothetical protein
VKKSTFYFCIIIVIISDSILAAKKITFEELCKYDKFCSKLKSFDGSFVYPKETLLEYISTFSEVIKAKADKLGVDPRAVAGAIIGENSLNVQVDDEAVDVLVKMKLAPSAQVLGHKFTIGMGQIHTESAMEVEPTLAKIFGRKLRTEEEIASALVTPEGSIEYAAGIVKYSQDCYKQEGIDVADNPAILTTLYNLGGACERAKEAAKTKEPPKTNYFGYFVDKNLPSIDRYLAKKQGNIDYQEPAGDEKNQYLAETSVFRNVPKCYRDGAGKVGEYNQAASFTDALPGGRVKGNFRVISRDVDCDLKSWVMIQDSSGRTGWLSNQELNDKAKIQPSRLARINSSFFDCAVDDSCIEKVKTDLGKDFVKYDPETGLAKIRYIGRNKDFPADPTKFGQYCLNPDDSEMYRSFPTAPTSDPFLLKPEDLAKYLNEIETFKLKLMKKFSIKQDEWDKHPFSNAIGRFKSTLESCKDSVCKIYPEQIKKFLSIQPAGTSLADLVKVNMELNRSILTIYNESNSSIMDMYKNVPEQPKAIAGAKSANGYGGYMGGNAMMGMPGGMITAGSGPQSKVKAMPKSEMNANSMKGAYGAYGGGNGYGSMGNNSYGAYGNNGGGTTAEDILATFKKCRPALKSDVAMQESVDKVITELNKVYKKLPLNSNFRKSAEWLCDRILEKASGKKSGEVPKCEGCGIYYPPTGNSMGYLQIDLFAKYLPEIKEKELVDILKNSLNYDMRNFASQVPGLKKMSGFLNGNIDDEASCNYEPFKNKERLDSLLKNDCVAKVLVNDPFLIGKFRTEKKQVTHFKTINNDEFAVQIKRKCGAGYQFLDGSSDHQ